MRSETSAEKEWGLDGHRAVTNYSKTEFVAIAFQINNRSRKVLDVESRLKIHSEIIDNFRQTAPAAIHKPIALSS